MEVAAVIGKLSALFSRVWALFGAVLITPSEAPCSSGIPPSPIEVPNPTLGPEAQTQQIGIWDLA